MPMIAFAYQTTLDFDKAADVIDVIGEAATLTLDGTDYPVQVAWITKAMACYIFNRPGLPSGEGAIYYTRQCADHRALRMKLVSG